MIYGYARCSTNEDKQDINRQVAELKRAGAEQVYLEYEHGDAVIKRQLTELLDACKEGDTIITLEVSRLARSVKQLIEITDTIKAKKLCLKVVGSITVDCTTGTLDPFTQAFLTISGVFAELELNIIRQRVKSGMANAKNKGITIGRPSLTKETIPDIFFRHYPLYLNKTITLTELSRLCQKSRNTIYKYIEVVNSQEKRGKSEA